MAAPQPAVIGMRSGDLINQSTTTTGLLGALLSPFIRGCLMFLENHSAGYLKFGDGYETQATMGVIVIVMMIVGRLHMRGIRKSNVPPEQIDAVVPGA